LGTRHYPISDIRYPDPAVEIIEQAFEKYVIGNAALERLHTGARWTEVPAWFGDGRFLLWSDIPNNPKAEGLVLEK
jgi:gluconolactonase